MIVNMAKRRFIQRIDVMTRLTILSFFALVVLSRVVFPTPCTAQQTQPRPFTLIAPLHDVTIRERSVLFQWEAAEPQNASQTQPVRYEVTFWSNRDDFGVSFTVTVTDSTRNTPQLRLTDFRDHFRRHGRYFWRVTAIDTTSRETTTPVWSFIVGIPGSRKPFTPNTFLYALEAQFVQRVKTQAYSDFLDTVSPTTNLRSFSDIGFIFMQSIGDKPRLDFQEKFYIVSHIGVGLGLSGRIRLVQNPYISVYPRVGTSVAHFSTGLRDYASTLVDVRLGCDWVVMPRGYLTLRTSWLPVYHIRYAQKAGGLRTFKGSGCEVGIRCILSPNIMAPLRIFGMEIDFQRIPLEVAFGSVTDSYTQVRMPMRRLTVSYLLR